MPSNVQLLYSCKWAFPNHDVNGKADVTPTGSGERRRIDIFVHGCHRSDMRMHVFYAGQVDAAL